MEAYQFIGIITMIGGGFGTMIGFLTKRVPKGECDIRHTELNQDIKEIKANQAQMVETQTEMGKSMVRIETLIERMNGDKQ